METRQNKCKNGRAKQLGGLGWPAGGGGWVDLDRGDRDGGSGWSVEVTELLKVLEVVLMELENAHTLTSVQLCLQDQPR